MIETGLSKAAFDAAWNELTATCPGSVEFHQTVGGSTQHRFLHDGSDKRSALIVESREGGKLIRRWITLRGWKMLRRHN